MKENYIQLLKHQSLIPNRILIIINDKCTQQFFTEDYYNELGDLSI